MTLQNKLEGFLETQMTLIPHHFQSNNLILTIFLPLEPLTQTFVMPLQKYWGYNAPGRQFSPGIVKCVGSMCINHHSIFLYSTETDLILGATGVTEIELTSVIALDIKHVVSILWRHKEASASTAKIV